MELPFTVIRTIHPVGQGAFYTEKFYNEGEDNAEHTVVFDCGSKTKIGGAKKVCIERIVNNSLDSDSRQAKASGRGKRKVCLLPLFR